MNGAKIDVVMFKQKEWYVYAFNQGNLNGWRSYGVSHEPITDNCDITVLTRALAILDKVYPDEAWFEDFHEYWIAPVPAEMPIVCIRPKSNPFAGGWIVSPIVLGHLQA